MSDFKDNVKVAIRVRPLSQKEHQESDLKCISILESKTILLESKPEPRSFTYDNVADEKMSQEEVFEIVGKPITTSCIRGYNGTIFAYGQTGAGKTFTIQGAGCEEFSSQVKVNYHLRGILPRCFEYLFATISEEIIKNKSQYLVKCSFLEIYQENINDLLDSAPRNLQLREDMKKGVYVEGLIEETVKSVMETYELLNLGAQNRHVSFTSMNKESSRSHSVFTLIIESKNNIDGLFNFKTSRFHLIDLAGSERQKATDCAGERLKEAGMINKSLSALGNVINSLVDISEGKSRHVHYRDSKLTFLLKDSLGGNSKTFIIANVSPAVSAFAETLSTLKFAQRAKMIKNAAVVNEDVTGTVNLLRFEIKKLKDELALQKSLAGEMNSFCSKCNSTLSKNYELISLLENLKDLELLLEKNTRMRISSEKQLQIELQDKEESIKSLKSTLSKVESKANHDKMVLKFRDATIAKLQTGSDSPEIENLKKENSSLKEQVENNPLAAQLFVENRKLKAENELLKKELKVDPESWNGRIKEGHDYTEQLCEALKNLAEEKGRIGEWIRKLDSDNEELKKMMGDNGQEFEEKLKILEYENLTLGKKSKALVNKKSRDDFFADDENLLKSAEIIQDFFLDGENSSIVASYQKEIENLRQKLALFTEIKEEDEAKVKESEEKFRNLKEQLSFYLDVTENKDSQLKQSQQDIENLNETCEYLKSNLESLQKTLGEKDEESAEQLQTIARLENQLAEMIKSLTGSQEIVNECGNLTKKIEELQKEKEKFRKKLKNLNNEKKNLENLYENSMVQENNEKKNVSMLYEKLSTTLNELQEFKEKNQELNEKVEILEEEKNKLMENAAGFEEILEKNRALNEEKESLVFFIEELERKEQKLHEENNSFKERLKEFDSFSLKFQEIENENLIMLTKIAELTATTEELDNLKSENKANLTKSNNLQQDLLSHQSKIQFLENDLSSLKELLQSSTSKISLLSEQNLSLSSSLNEKRSSSESTIQDQSSKLSEQESLIKTLKSSLKSKQKELEIIKEQHSSELSLSNENFLQLGSKLQLLQQTHSRVFDKLSREKEKRREINQQASDLLENVRLAEGLVESLKANLIEKQEENEKISQNLNEKNYQVEELKKKLQDQVFRRKNLENDLNELKNEKNDLQVLVVNNSEVIQSLHEKILQEEEVLKAEIDLKNEISASFNEKVKEIKELHEKIAVLADEKEEILIEKNEIALTAKVNEEAARDLQKCLESERTCIEENIEQRLKAEEKAQSLEKTIETTQETLSKLTKILEEKQDLIQNLQENVETHKTTEKHVEEALKILKILPEEEKFTTLTLSESLKSLLKSPEDLASHSADKISENRQILSVICSQLSLPWESITQLPLKIEELTLKSEEIHQNNKILSEALQKEAKRAEILSKESDLLKQKISKSSSESSKELNSLKEELQDLHLKLSLSSSMPEKLQSLEQSTSDLSTKVEKLSQINQEISEENSQLRSQQVDLLKTREKLESDLQQMKEEVEALKEENKNKMEILKNTNKNILSTRNEINMWKKCIDDKNLLIQELRDEIRKKEEDLVKGQGRKRKESEEEEPEVRHLNQIILIKDKELKELKEKGQEYYAQADEALESQRKEIEIFTKRITALQGESKRLKEELKLSLKDRETMLEELKRLKSEEFRSHKEKEENRRQILQLREEKTKLLLELSKENEHPKGKSTEKVRMENIALKNQIEKLTQDLYLNRDSQNFSSRYREAGDKNLKVENEKQAEEIRNLTANLSKLTDFIFSLPGVSISSEETSLVESAIKVVKQLSQQSPDDSLKPDKAKFKSSLGQYYAMINKRQ